MTTTTTICRRAGLALGSVAAALLAGAPTATAGHATATADVTLDPGGKLPHGARKAVVRWNLTCGPKPLEARGVSVALYLRDRKRRPHFFRDLEPKGLHGRQRIALPAGGEFVARASLTCEDARTADLSRVVRTRPWLHSYRLPSQELCGVRSPGRHRRDLQVGIGNPVDLTATFYPALWMRHPRSTRELRVRFKGGGLPRSVRPFSDVWRHGRGEIEVIPRPRRAGKVRMWMEIGGVRTANKLTVRVLRLPRGCLG